MNGWCFVVSLADGFFKNVIVICKISKLYVKFIFLYFVFKTYSKLLCLYSTVRFRFFTLKKTIKFARIKF